ncbi:hypothetical protein BC939DRAFT_504231 [Gamsiella multidivaricata]|uniref:uncharacterized protein n=1 Tax=Gamsiella multidivaricata TaxID=101098 RepID=UPI00221FAA46|nr:uncharacterized protein BC939DRAFT_504231 [Gamsiella multidivaricata]KAG0362404.1 hypothetical protein BGZ54_008636 [Gamsiella multidivaricata]KAI7821705.1 hypothetical protein BC939DRAFT_504231 [Gamsiella multidivaricata]
MTQAMTITELSPRPSAIQFSENEDPRGRSGAIHPLSVHDEEHETPAVLSGIPLTKTKTSESTNSKSSGRRRSLAEFAERLRSRSHSRSRPNSGIFSNSENTKDRRKSSDEDYQFKYSRRKSSDFTGEYADVARAQALYMEKLREEQERKNVKQNIDGLPIPPPIQRRRSSVAQILGIDKPLLSR